jgi:hypothetical protein
LIHLTANAQRIVNQQLPAIHAVIADDRPPLAILLASASLAGRHQR